MITAFNLTKNWSVWATEVRNRNGKAAWEKKHSYNFYFCYLLTFLVAYANWMALQSKTKQIEVNGVIERNA